MSDEMNVEERWQKRLTEARVRISRGLEPERLAERYDAETSDEIYQLPKHATQYMIRRDYSELTLDDLDAAAEKLQGPEIRTDGGQSSSGTNRKVCLDLFAGLGGFSSAFEESEEWDVFTVELNPEFDPDLCADIVELSPDDLLELIGLDREEIDALVILASPPCTYFSTAGNHDSWNFDECRPISEGARNAVTLVFHTLGLIRALDPDYWFLENPQGRLRWFLDRPTGQVTYCQYGRPYMKRTDLWGDHPPMTYHRCSRGSKCHVANVEYDGTSATRVLGDTHAERSKVPYELSEAILEATETAIETPPPEQQTLVAASDGGNTRSLHTETERGDRA